MPAPRRLLGVRVFQSLTVTAVRTLVSRRAAEAGLDPAKSHDLVLAACEIATNSVRHAGGWGLLRVWSEDDVLVCEVADRGQPTLRLTGQNRPVPDQEDGYGLWIADHVCDGVEMVQTQAGTVVRLRMRVVPAGGAGEGLQPVAGAVEEPRPPRVRRLRRQA